MIQCIQFSHLRVRDTCWNADTQAGMNTLHEEHKVKMDKGERKKELSPLTFVHTSIYGTYIFLLGCYNLLHAKVTTMA